MNVNSVPKYQLKMSTTTLGLIPQLISDWQFTDTVLSARATRLRSWLSFDDIVSQLLTSSIEGFWWEPFLSAELKGCHRASFTMKVSSTTYDAFFNSPVGYRAQYASSPTNGEAANRKLIDALGPLLLRASEGQTQVEPSRLMASLRAFEAKIWIVETEVEDQLSDSRPAIAYPPWEFDCPDGQGLRAPVGTMLEVKGGWLDSDGNECRNSRKVHRSLQIFKAGFS